MGLVRFARSVDVRRLLHRVRIGAPIVAAAVVAGASSCHRGVFAPAGAASSSLAHTGTFLFVLLSLVAVAMIGIIAFASLKTSGTLAEHAPFDLDDGKSAVLIGGAIIPGAIVASIFVVTLTTMSKFPLHDDEGRAPDVTVVGHQWWWEIHVHGRDVVTANELHVPVGTPVQIDLETRDVIHSFWVPRLHGKVDLVPGKKNRIRIEADAAGVYEGTCAEYCGSEHALMRFVVVAEPPDQFARWLAHEAAPASPPADAEAVRGAALFAQHSCAVCHAVRGTDAHGAVGPDLTHIGNRRGIASMSLPMQHAYLEAWITRAQSFKPDAKMPDVTDFTGDELIALTHYLEGLR